MTQREKNLALVIAAIIVGWIGWTSWGSYQTALDQRQKAVINAQAELNKAQIQQRYVKRAALEQLVGYQKQSLPSDPQVAQQAYLAWLLDQLEAAGLDFDDVNLTERRPRGEAYTSLSYTAKAEGKLDDVTRFLHSFYNTPMLHKITSFKLTPLERGKLRVNMNVTALAIPGADAKSDVPAGESGRPLLGDVGEYLVSIQGRDVFSQYIPPPPPRPKPKPRPVVKRDPPPPKPKFDDANHAVVTGIVQAGDKLQAWITVRTTGEVLRLSAGDELSVGLLRGTIEAVTAKQVIFQSDDTRYATTLGATLREGVELEAEPML